MSTNNEYKIQFIHLNILYSITYVIVFAPYKKDHLMYRLRFPLKKGGAKEMVVFKDKAGNFSGSRNSISPVLLQALKEIRKTEMSATQIINIR